MIGAGPEVLLLPGFGANHTAWSPLVPALKRDFRLVLVDLPGTGHGPPLTKTHGVRQLSAPLEGLLDHLHVSKIAIVGASLGGMVGMQFARDHPERVSRLVTAGSMARLEPAHRDHLMKRVEVLRAEGAGAFARFLVQGMVSPAFAEEHPRLVEAAVHAYAVGLPSPDGLEILARLVADTDFRPHLGEIAAPVLVLHGDLDRQVSTAQAELLASAIPRATLRILPGAGHHLLLERRSEALAAIKTFLRTSP